MDEEERKPDSQIKSVSDIVETSKNNYQFKM